MRTYIQKVSQNNYPSYFSWQDLLVAMKALGLNPTETEIQDLINEVERNGFIYYPAFCRVIMRKLREDDEENFRRELFRTMVGPKKYDGVPAPIYNYSREYLTFEQVPTYLLTPSTLSDHSIQTKSRLPSKCSSQK